MIKSNPTIAEQRASAILLPGVVLECNAQKKTKQAAPDRGVAVLQGRLGVTPDGIIGPATLKAAGGDALLVQNLTTSRVVVSSSFQVGPSGTILVGKSELENNPWIRNFVARGILRIVSTYEQPAYDLVFTDEE